MGRVSGKVAIVTGAASGLGRADAEALVREGARVVITDVNAAGIEKLAAELNARQPDSALGLVQDVRDEGRWTAVVATAVEKFGALHVLVNNAGVVQMATPETCTLEQFRFQNSVMSEGVFLGCRTAIRTTTRSGRSLPISRYRSASIPATSPSSATRSIDFATTRARPVSVGPKAGSWATYPCAKE